jgi:hypothetical protein
MRMLTKYFQSVTSPTSRRKADQLRHQEQVYSSHDLLYWLWYVRRLHEDLDWGDRHAGTPC